MWSHKETFLSAVDDAHQKIEKSFVHSPQYRREVEWQGRKLDLIWKFECFNPIGCFKGRGTQTLAARLADTTDCIVAASAGNFGQGLAYACSQKGIELQMFVAHNANALKVERMREFGASIHYAGEDFDAAKNEAREFAEQRSLKFVEDGREPELEVGTATIAKELFEEFPQIDEIVVPVGNGALVNGIGRWGKFVSPATKIVGVCAAQAPAMERSWRTGELVCTDSMNSIADGLALRMPVDVAVERMRQFVDEVILVSEGSLVRAMVLMLNTFGIALEPSGAAAVAAVMEQGERSCQQAVVISGNNLSQQMREELYRDASQNNHFA